MVALWLRHDNDDDQRHSERNTPRIKKTRSGKSAQSEQRDNFYFRDNARRGEPRSGSNSPISERRKKSCKAKVNQTFENDWRRNFMKNPNSKSKLRVVLKAAIWGAVIPIVIEAVLWLIDRSGGSGTDFAFGIGIIISAPALCLQAVFGIQPVGSLTVVLNSLFGAISLHLL